LTVDTGDAIVGEGRLVGLTIGCRGILDDEEDAVEVDACEFELD